ncbi:DUF4123 domain-containing protein [Burkholderia sp. JSH-S8]|nr:DUF4123 domain-containing protein [Burkholderia sp. JSH-S8]
MSDINGIGNRDDVSDADDVNKVVDDAPNPREPEWPAFLEGLKASLARESDDGRPLRLHALVDTRGYHGLDEQLSAVPGLRHASLWTETSLDIYPDIAPYLIAFDRDALEDEDAEPYRLLRQLWLDAVDLHAVTWMWSTWTFDALDAHLRRYVKYALPNGRAYYLFFFDNHVLGRLRQVWSDAQSQQFVAPFVEIRYRDRRLEEVAWRNDAPVAAGATLAGDVPGVSEPQHVKLIELGYPDKLVLKFRETMAASVDHLSDGELYEQVVDQLERAAGRGIVDEQQLSCYVAMGVQFAPRFDEHPAVQACLAAVAHGETNLDDALLTIDDATWDAIRDAHERELLKTHRGVV